MRKLAIGKGHDNATGCLLDCNYFNKYYKTIAIALSKQQATDSDPRAIQRINFKVIRNRSQNVNNNTTMFFDIKREKKPF